MIWPFKRKLRLEWEWVGLHTDRRSSEIALTVGEHRISFDEEGVRVVYEPTGYVMAFKAHRARRSYGPSAILTYERPKPKKVQP